MKNICYAFIMLLAIVSCQKPNKIGYVDNGTLVKDYQMAKDLEEKFKGKEELLRLKADSIGKAFQLEVQETQLKAQKSSQKKAQELMTGLQQKQALLQQQMQFDQQQLGQSLQIESDSLVLKIKAFIKDYGKKNGYTFILGTSDGASSVIYGKDETDLTQTILEALNAEYVK